MHEQSCPRNSNWYSACECDEIRQRDHTAALVAHTEELRKSSILIGGGSEGCGGGIHHLVDRLQAENAELSKKIGEFQREREAVKDCLKMPDLFAALSAIERIVYMGVRHGE